MRKAKAYFVDYNGKIIAIRKTLRGALSYISRHGLKDDFDNTLRLVDDRGYMYNPFNGKEL